ncbi:inhibitory synaptic factor 2A [Boleophthalmus pectinirostris]|uniref:inhibitory synaptic factor 2A n=1 Tax=Boleophthalmus pectinirostris TaxID=150288 RepID=UPI00242B6F6B|nr:inhibitory synaptic factor 2A [Boleophthalmus pectinirostris]
MVSKEGGRCMLTNSESDSEAAPVPSTSLALEKFSLEASRQVRKRNKALQVRFKDICEAQNEQREAELQAARKAGKPISYKVAYRKYMTVPARRSIPNVTKSTGVQTSPDLKKRYQTFPFERKKGHTFKHVAAVETYRGQNNGVMVDGKHSQTDLDDDEEEGGACGGSGLRRTRALLHNECVATVEQHRAPDGLCSELLLSCSADADCLPDAQDYQLCSAPVRTGVQQPQQADKRQLLHLEEGASHTLPDRGSRVTGPIAWNSLTQVECLDSPSVRRKKKTLQLNGLQAETLPRAGGCMTQAQCHPGRLSAPPLSSPPPDSTQNTCKQIVPLNQDGDVKAQLQAMENLISSSQETIKVLLGVIQELEKGEAHREGLSYRTGQDTANCDTCRNSACIIYSVELDFKLQEDKLQPLMKRLCPTEESHLPALPYPQEALYSSTPKRKSKAEAKKHARWRLWFL